MNKQEPIEVKAETYNPWCEFGVNKMLKLIAGKQGERYHPIMLEVEDPQFGRLLRLLSSGNANTDKIGQFDHHLKYPSRGIDTFIRVKCIGGRIAEQRKYKGENEL